MKRVLQVVSTLNQGGMETVILNYFSKMPKEKIMFDFLIIYGDKKGYHENFLFSQGCEIFRLKNSPRKFFAHGKELREFFKTHDYDIVHIHAMTSLRYRVAKAAKKCGVKTVIYHSHNSSNESHLWLHKWLKGRLNKWCDYKFACSHAAGNYMYYGAYDIVFNAIDLRHFEYNVEYREELRAKYELKDKFVIGNIARLTRVKNQMFLLRVAKIIKRSKANFVVFCIGEGAERAQLQSYADENGLNDNLILAGTVGTDVYKYYSMFDCLAFPSQFEGLSMVLIEAQANGVPIIASDRLTVEHKLSDNFIFLSIDESEENYNAWAEYICNGLDDRRNNDEKLQAAGYDIVKEASKLEELYLNL